MARPKQIKIGPNYYKVIFLKEPDTNSRGNNLHGCIKYDEKEIRIHDSHHAKLTLLHEILHGIWSDRDLDGKEEKTVNQMSIGLLAVIQDNKGLAEYLFS